MPLSSRQSDTRTGSGMNDQSVEALEKSFKRNFHRVIEWMTLGPLLLLTAVWLYLVFAADPAGGANIGAGILFLSIVPVGVAFILTRIARRVRSSGLLILLACIAGILVVIPLTWLAFVFVGIPDAVP